MNHQQKFILNSVMSSVFVASSIMVCVCLLLVASNGGIVDASPMQLNSADQIDSNGRSSGVALALVESPELTARVLESLLRSVVYSASAADLQATNTVAQKRGLDLGISRGFSGSQAGKHLMGLSAASFANGPGRR